MKSLVVIGGVICPDLVMSILKKAWSSPSGVGILKVDSGAFLEVVFLAGSGLVLIAGSVVFSEVLCLQELADFGLFFSLCIGSFGVGLDGAVPGSLTLIC